MNYSNHILDYSKYNYICLPKAGSQPLFRGVGSSQSNIVNAS